MKRLIASAFLVALCILPALGQTAAPLPDPAKIALGQEIFDLVASKEILQARLAAIEQAVRQAAPPNPPGRVPANPSAVVSGLGQIMQDMLPEMREIYANAYAQRFSLEELQTIKAFYESPAGKKLTAENPEIGRQALQAILPKMIAAIAAQQSAHPSTSPAPAIPPAPGSGP